MTTTIAVQESTALMLAQLKEKMKANNLDETIVTMLKKMEKIPNSRFGSNPTLKKFSEKERAKFHGL